MDIVTKFCNKCGAWKDRSEFNKNKRAKDGLFSRCKSCSRKQSREWAVAHPHGNKDWQKAHPESNRARMRKYRKTARYRQNIEANREKRQERHRERHKRNPEETRERVRNWRAAHPEKILEHNNNRRARKKGNGGEITGDEWRWLKEFYDHTCLRCRQREPEIKLTLDHVLPLVMGGRNVISNAQPLCLSCNSSKGARHIDYRPKNSTMMF